MHPDYYKEHWERFPHHRQYPEASSVQSRRAHAHFCGRAQIPEEAIALFRSPKARAAGLVYLDEEACSFRITPEGRIWTVFGSPVSPYSDTRSKLHTMPLVDAILWGLRLQL
jgi:hypothetical protein